MLSGKINLPAVSPALLVVCAVALCFPNDLHASCGDYVLMASQHDSSREAVNPSLIAAGLSDTDDAIPCSCRGLSCSRRPSQPPFMPDRFNISSLDQWWLVSKSLDLPVDNKSVSPLLPVKIHSIRRVQSIFRPPR